MEFLRPTAIRELDQAALPLNTFAENSRLYSPAMAPFFIEFPTRSNRDNLRRIRELIRRNREFPFGISEPLRGPRRRR
jgi:hypothetical protein